MPQSTPEAAVVDPPVDSSAEAERDLFLGENVVFWEAQRLFLEHSFVKRSARAEADGVVASCVDEAVAVGESRQDVDYTQLPAMLSQRCARTTVTGLWLDGAG